MLDKASHSIYLPQRILINSIIQMYSRVTIFYLSFYSKPAIPVTDASGKADHIRRITEHIMEIRKEQQDLRQLLKTLLRDREDMVNIKSLPKPLKNIGGDEKP